jgi:hypothetical protein
VVQDEGVGCEVNRGRKWRDVSNYLWDGWKGIEIDCGYECWENKGLRGEYCICKIKKIKKRVVVVVVERGGVLLA